VGGYAAVHGPRQLLYPVGWGTLGYGLPAALGVAASGTPTLAVVGDGGLAMTTGELATLAQEHLPVTALVVTDGGYGMLRFDQQRAGHAERGVDLDPPDWAALGAAFGLPVERPADDDDLRDVLARAAVSGEPRLVVYHATLYPPRSTSPRWGDPDG
jgi:acetolactate synthase-1/2/3 large subunit